MDRAAAEAGLRNAALVPSCRAFVDHRQDEPEQDVTLTDLHEQLKTLNAHLSGTAPHASGAAGSTAPHLASGGQTPMFISPTSPDAVAADAEIDIKAFPKAVAKILREFDE